MEDSKRAQQRPEPEPEQVLLESIYQTALELKTRVDTLRAVIAELEAAAKEAGK